jgi:transglutaminase-like putative cysteine protease
MFSAPLSNVSRISASFISSSLGVLPRISALPRFTQQLIWAVAGFALAVLPHIPDLTPWVVLLAAASAALRITIEIKHWRLPAKFVRILVAIAAMFGVLLTYRTLNGLEAGTAFLVVTGAMKLLETRTVRDLTVLIFVSYFLLFAGFLYDQSLLLLPWMLVSVWFLTATLMRTHQTAPMKIREALGLTGKMLLQALPVAVLLFLFFPRLPGQFWALPARDHATMGLDEEMSPGDVSELSVSGAIAFRAKFDGRLPPPRERYWRGLVLHDFDGRTWRRLRVFSPPLPLATQGPAYRYNVTLEPHNRRWVFALDAVTDWPQERASRTFDQQLLARDPIAAMTTFALQSHTAYHVEGPLPASARLMDLRPGNGNPRTKQLAAELRARAGSDAAFVQAVLAKFRDEEYFYTLEPPRLAADSVDDFLFNTRRGFCEHFASAFTMLARAAGIPARVVTGYQGGEFNPMGGYLIVRQSDAHAWSEVWLEGQGWTRVDPTGAVAPERVEHGLDAAMSEDEPVPGRFLGRISAFTQVRLAWDALNTFWNDEVVEFSARQQRSLLERLGIKDADWEALGVALVLTLAGFFTALSLYLAWQFRPHNRDPVARIYAQLCRRFASKQLPRLPHEGPSDYIARITQARPDLAASLTEARTLYISLRYGPSPLASQLSRLKFLVSQLRL